MVNAYVHWVFHRATERLKAYRLTDGIEIFDEECRNRAIGDGYSHFGMCPPGDYALGALTTFDPSQVAYGKYFIAVDDPLGNFDFYGRAGIGIHGGGSGLSNPFADAQGWVETEGCFRLQNGVLSEVVRLYVPGERFTVTAAQLP